MSPQDFLAHFHEIANAPGGVARLRELIRTLAIQGVLVTQQSSDGDARKFLSDLLEHKFASESNQRKRLTSVDEITAKLGESPGLPMNWVRVLFGDIMINRDGERVPVSKAERETRLGQYDYYGASGVIDKIDSFLFDKPLLLIGEDGANLLNRSTPIAFMARGKYWVNNHAHVLDGYNEDFLRYIELHINAITLEAYVTGTAQPKMNQAKMNSIPIALPPLAEQKRIVAKVEELMALCDALEAQQQERARLLPRLSRATHTRLTDSPTRPHLDSLFADLASISPEDMRRTIIKLAFQGNLTQQLPNDDPADAIVQRLSAARSRHETKRGLRSRIPLDIPLQSSSAPFGIPNSWKWVRLHEVAWIKHGYAFDSESFSDTPTDYVVATPGNFFERGGFRDRGVRTKYYAGKVDPEFIFQAGDLIIPMTEQAPGLLGSPAFIPEDGKTYIHNQRLGKLCFYSEEVLPWFAYWFFNTPFFRSELSRTCTGMKVRHTSPSRVLAVPFPICSLAEQRRIVAKVDELMALVDTLEAQQQEKSRLAEAFAQTCVASFTNA